MEALKPPALEPARDRRGRYSRGQDLVPRDPPTLMCGDRSDPGIGGEGGSEPNSPTVEQCDGAWRPRLVFRTPPATRAAIAGRVAS